MNPTVVADARFLTPERLQELQEHADVHVSVQSVLSNTDLGEPAGTEVVVGNLTLPEARLYAQLYEAHLQMEDLTRDSVGRHLSKLGETLRQSDRNKSLADVFRDSEDRDLMKPDAETTKRFHHAERRMQMLHACFYYHVGERLDMHEWRLGVRSKGRVVKIEKR